VRIPQVNVDLVINRYRSIPALSFEGAQNAIPESPHWLIQPGVLILLTMCKVISYRNEMNQM